MEANPWWKNLPAGANLPASYGCTGVKPDGGGSMAGKGKVGPMRLHRAAALRDAAALAAALAAGDDPTEVEAVRERRGGGEAGRCLGKAVGEGAVHAVAEGIDDQPAQ